MMIKNKITKPIKCELKEIKELSIIKVSDKKSLRIWQYLIKKYHYIKETRLVGRQIKYLVKSEFGYLGAISFSASAWSCEARDIWIGWDKETREKNINLIINNSRFLILPEVEVKNLASNVISKVLKIVSNDWQETYGYKPLLVETFVDRDRFTGACYQASNWIKVGETKGRGQFDIKKKEKLPIKYIYMYPMEKKAREKIGGEEKEIKIEKKEKWSKIEFENIEIKDRRIKERLYNIGEDFYNNPEANIPKACGSRAKTKGCYRLLNREDMNMGKILNSHKKATEKRIKKEKVVLSVQDTTSLTYTDHKAKKGLGYLTNNINSKGIMLHDTMAFTTEGVALGLIDVQTWERDPEKYGKNVNRAKVPLEEKESYKWFKSYESTYELQKKMSKTKLVSVGDREADIYELFELAKKDENSPELLVRANYNRNLIDEDKKLWDLLEKKAIAGKLTIDVPRKPGQKKRQAIIDITFSQVTINTPKGKGMGGLKIYAILVKESKPPKGIKAICWKLLTTIRINTLEEAIEKIKWYAIRWQIEVYHKIIKSGCRIENRQLENLQALKTCIGIDMVVAWRILYLVKESRQNPDLDCTVHFKDCEWKALYMVKNKTKKLPSKPPSLRTMVHMVASLGGFLGRKCDGDPGPKTLWEGLTRLKDIVETYLFLTSSEHKFNVQTSFG